MSPENVPQGLSAPGDGRFYNNYSSQFPNNSAGPNTHALQSSAQAKYGFDSKEQQQSAPSAFSYSEPQPAYPASEGV